MSTIQLINSLNENLPNSSDVSSNTMEDINKLNRVSNNSNINVIVVENNETMKQKNDISNEKPEETIIQKNDISKGKPAEKLEECNIEITVNEPIEKPKEKRKRIYWVDALRVFANFLVLLTHVALRFDKSKLGSKDWYILSFYNSVSRPCVPLFVMISGILFLNPKKEVTCKTMFSKYILRIFKSYVFWTLYYNVFEENIFKYINKKGNFKITDEVITETITKSIASNHNHLWYLNFVMGLYMVTPILKKITPDRSITWYACIIFSIVTQLVPTVHVALTNLFEVKEFSIIKTYTDGLKVEIAGSYVTYYLLGYLLNKDFSKKRYIYLSYFLGIIGTALTYVLKILYSLKLESNNFYFLDFNCIGVVLATIGTYVIFKYHLKGIIDYLVKFKLFEKILVVLSDCSFGIYLIHMSIQRISNEYIPINMYNPIIWAPVLTIIIYIISFIIIYALRMIPIFRQVM